MPLRVVAVGFAPGELDEAKVLGEIPDYQRPGVLIPRGQSSSGDQFPLFGVETLVNHGRNYYNDSKPFTRPVRVRLEAGADLRADGVHDRPLQRDEGPLGDR